jgi:hypothetical protein
MGVNITTATAEAGGLFSANKFTDGNVQGGTPPTQFESAYCNAVMVEINAAIDKFEVTPVYGTTVASWQQLGGAIQSGIRNFRSRGDGETMLTCRTHDDTGTLTANDWMRRERTSFFKDVADNTVQTFGTILGIPNDSQFWVTFEACVVKIGALTTYSNVVLRASCRKTGGTVTVEKTTTVDSDGALGVTWSVVNNSGNPAIRASLPVDAAAKFNGVVSGRAINVTSIA